MNRYSVKIKLLSETIFGGGQSNNGLVNTDILIDSDGFPYYLGKTFKGCLKQAINTIIKPSYSNQGEFNIIIKSLFGSPGCSENEGKLRFGNFYLAKDIKELFIKTNKLSKNESNDIILSSLTDIRFGIKMGDTGISEKGTLRASRVLKKTLVFYGDIYVDKELSIKEEEILKNGIMAVKNLGVNKTRGKGNVQIDIYRKQSTLNNRLNTNKDNIKDKKYVLYEFELLEPIKVGDSQSQDDYEESKSYISGSIVRGAIINKYLKECKDNSIDKLNTILKNVNFYDAYPIYTHGNKKEYAFPTPSIFRIDKETDKKDENCYIRFNQEYKKESNSYFTSVFDEMRGNIESGTKDAPKVIKLKKGEFSWYDDMSTLHQFDIRKDYHFHHACIGQENIFRYKAISKGQKFYGIIDLCAIEDEKIKNIIYNLLEENPILHLGGSRTSGYGTTQVISLKTYDTSKELNETLHFPYSEDTKNKYINIYFLSDCILRDKYHQVISIFNSDYFKDNLGINIRNDDIQADINPTIITGYNSKWKSYIPHMYGIEKGSVIEIKLQDTKSRSAIIEFMNSQIGDRKQDGLGRVIINPSFLQCNDIKIHNTIEVNDIESKEEEYKESINEDTKIKIEHSIIDKLQKKYMNEYIKNNIDSIYDEVKSLSSTQLRDVIVEIDKILLSYNAGKQCKVYLEKLMKNTQSNVRNNKNSLILSMVCIKLTNKKKVLFKQVLEMEDEDIQKIEVINDINIKFSSIVNTEEIEEHNRRLILKLIKEELYFCSRMLQEKEGNEYEASK